LRAAGIAALVAGAVMALAGRRADVRRSVAAAGVDSLTEVYTLADRGRLVDSTANVIVDSTGSLAPFILKLSKLRTGGDGVVSVLHIGDSHIQAGFLTGRVRELMQADFGNAGRGLITPYRMAGMNEPRDYAITARYACRTAKATDRDPRGAGFTGVDMTFGAAYNELTVRCNTPFTGVTVFHAPAAPALDEPEWLNIGSYCPMANTPTSTYIPLAGEVDSLTFRGFTEGAQNDPTFYGFSLDNGRAGVLYHAVGVNGAAFEHMGAVARGGASALRPDLVIISLGTNNSYGSNFREGQLYNVVDGFVREVKSAYPDAAVLVSTPMEACRKAGRRRVPNPNIVATGRIIRDVATANEVALWDLYAAAGGEGAMERWAARGLTNADRIHLTEAGYILQGEMLYDAIVRQFNTLAGR
jgi:lysophospholipase L1-like esterase